MPLAWRSDCTAVGYFSRWRTKLFTEPWLNTENIQFPWLNRTLVTHTLSLTGRVQCQTLQCEWHCHTVEPALVTALLMTISVCVCVCVSLSIWPTFSCHPFSFSPGQCSQTQPIWKKTQEGETFLAEHSRNTNKPMLSEDLHVSDEFSFTLIHDQTASLIQIRHSESRHAQ